MMSAKEWAEKLEGCLDAALQDCKIRGPIDEKTRTQFIDILSNVFAACQCEAIEVCIAICREQSKYDISDDDEAACKRIEKTVRALLPKEYHADR